MEEKIHLNISKKTADGNRGQKHSAEFKQKLSEFETGRVTVIDKDNKVFRISTNDPRYLTGELKNCRLGCIIMNNGIKNKYVIKLEIEKYTKLDWKIGKIKKNK